MTTTKEFTISPPPPVDVRRQGKFFVVEGMDGSGKSECTGILEQCLLAGGISLRRTLEVGGTPIGKQLRGIAFTTNPDEALDPAARTLLMYAARLQHLKRVVLPSTESGITVLSDRFTPSSRVYQGVLDGQTELMDRLDILGELQGCAVHPDAYVYLSVDHERAYARGKARTNVDNDVYKQGVEQAKLIREAYDKHMRRLVLEGVPVYVVDANQPLEVVQAKLAVIADELIKMVNLAPVIQ